MVSFTLPLAFLSWVYAPVSASDILDQSDAIFGKMPGYSRTATRVDLPYEGAKITISSDHGQIWLSSLHRPAGLVTSSQLETYLWSFVFFDTGIHGRITPTGEIDLRRRIQLQGYTRQRIFSDLFNFAQISSSVAHQFPASGKKPPKVDLSRRIDSLTFGDIESIIEACGWPQVSGFFSGPVVPVCTIVNEVPVVLSNDPNSGRLTTLAIRAQGEIAKQKDGGKALEAELQQRFKCEVTCGNRSVWLLKVIDLEKGIRLSDLKKSIERFTREIKPVAAWQ